MFNFVFLAKYGTPNTRIEELFSCIPHLRELGVLHHKWTMVHLLKQESKEAARALDAQRPQISPSSSTCSQGGQMSQGQSQMTATVSQSQIQVKDEASSSQSATESNQ